MTDIPDLPGLDADRLTAALDYIRRTGALKVSIRYQDDDDPTVWIAVVTHKFHLRTKMPVAPTAVGKKVHTCTAAFDPLAAVLMLGEKLMDGGTCVHCRRPAGFEPYDIGDMPLANAICWVQWDPELKEYRRDCAGD